MAFNTPTNRATQIQVDLSGVLNAGVENVTAVRRRERAIGESKFQEAVAAGLSYEDQIAYRKEQVDRERRKPSQDNEYLTELNASIANLRKLKRFRDMRESYFSIYDDYKTGRASLSDLERSVKSQLSQATDEEMRSELRQELSNIRQQKSESEIQTLNNRVQLARLDGTVNILETTINDIEKRRAFADLNGNDEEASAWDVSLTTLRKQLNETRVANSMHDLDFNIGRKGGTSMQKLEMLNTEIQNADNTSPITIEGVTYGSAREFWEGRRDSYVAGTGTDPNFKSFFNDFETEIKTKIDTASRVNNYGFVPVPTLEAIQNDYQSLAGRAEFAAQADKLQSSQVAALGYGVDKSAGALIESSVETLQLQSGLETLNSLEAKFGVDLESRKAELNREIISKGASLPSIKDAAQELANVGAETPSTETPDELTPGSVFQQNNQPDPITPPEPEQPEGTNPNQPVVDVPEVVQPEEPRQFASSVGQASVVDYLKSQGADSSRAGRAKLFAERGLGTEDEYQGTAEQNTQLLKAFE